MSDQVASALRLAEALAEQLATERERATIQLTERDQQLAARDKRIADLEQMRFELAGQVGYYQAQLDVAREQIKLLEGPKTEGSTVSNDVMVVRPPRRWWQMWRRS